MYISIGSLTIICWVVIALLSCFVVIPVFYKSYSVPKRIKKDSKYILNISYENGHKLDPSIFVKALSLVSTLCWYGFYDVVLEPSDSDEIAININDYGVYMILNNNSISGYSQICNNPKEEIKFIFDTSRPTWQNDTAVVIQQAFKMIRRKS